MVHSRIILVNQPNSLRSPRIRLWMRSDICVENEILGIVYSILWPRLHARETSLRISLPEAIRILVMHETDPAAVHEPGNFRMRFWLIQEWRQSVRRNVANPEKL